MAGVSPGGASGADGVHVRHLQVARSARYALLGPVDGSARELWFVLHGYRQLAHRFVRQFRGLDEGGHLFVAPEGLSRFYLDDRPGRHGPDARVGATWMTREDRDAEIRDYVAYLDHLAGHLRETLGAPARVGVLGFSQGVHTAARWIAYGNVRPYRTILWSAYLPRDLDLARTAERFRATDLVLAGGRADDHRRADLEQEQEARLTHHAIPCRIEWHEGGHMMDRRTLQRLLAQPARPIG